MPFLRDTIVKYKGSISQSDKPFGSSISLFMDSKPYIGTSGTNNYCLAVFYTSVGLEHSNEGIGHFNNTNAAVV